MSCYHAINGNIGNSNDVVRIFERQPLLASAESNTSIWSLYKMTHHHHNRCITSKSALLTLLWNIIIGFVFGSIYQVIVFQEFHVQHIGYDQPLQLKGYFAIVLFYCFHPLAGCLADLKFGRHKTIMRCIHVLLVLLFIAIPLEVPYILLVHTKVLEIHSTRYKIAVILLYAYFFTLFTTILPINANIIQFGMDQLHDSIADHQNLFILWYFWTYNAGYFISQLSYGIIMNHGNTIISNLRIIPGAVFINMFSVVVLAVTLYKANRNKGWFLIDSPRNNPYKLVYQVTRFARQHSVPVYRSAFTYCEDAIPSGLDLAKTKYGGPFTTEQVEDVKAFYGIVKILLALGPVFFMDIASDHLYNNYYFHFQNNFKGILRLLDKYLLSCGVLLSVLIIILIPFYIFFIRRLVYRYIPGLLKCIGLGIILMVTSLTIIFVLDTGAHLQERDSNMCVLKLPIFNDSSNSPMSENGLVLVIPFFLSACYTLLIYIGMFQFICSQSPHSMKGLFIGLFFATKGVFELLGMTVSMLFAKFIKPQAFPSCGMEYYIMNICVGVFTILIYIIAARNYQFRLRDEPCHVRRYVEDYYSKIQNERFRTAQNDKNP